MVIIDFINPNSTTDWPPVAVLGNTANMEIFMTVLKNALKFGVVVLILVSFWGGHTVNAEDTILLNESASTTETANLPFIQDFLDITISSSPETEIIKEISLGSSVVFIPIAGKEEITILLENLPNQDLYFYIDSLENVVQRSANESPNTTFTLNGYEPHLIFIKTQPSTKTIRNDTTGGDCSTFGIWNQVTLTCTMTQDVFEVIQIVNDNITLDGNGKIVKWNNGFGVGSGINIAFRKNITVKNLIIEGFDSVIGVFQTTNSRFLNNETRGFGLGFFLSFNDFDNLIDGNVVTNTAGYIPGVNIISTGILLTQNTQRTTVRNNTISVTNIGVAMSSNVNNNKVYNNNFMSIPNISSFSNSANLIYQPMPIGGNYYRNHDTPEEGCNDINNDFICDTAISFGNVTDNFPWKIPDGWKVPTCTTCFSNVLFLPGIMGSRLYEQDNGDEDQLWEPNTNSDVEDLYLNPDGTSMNLDIYTRDIIKETNTPFPAGALGQNIYKSFSETMDQLVTDQKIKKWKEYAYDWRQDIEDIVSNGTKYQNETVSLIDTLQSLVDSESKNGKVTIVAHSNGGLLAKTLLKKLQDDKVAGINNLIDNIDVLILVAVPEIGTAKAVPAILHGYDQRILSGWLMDEIHARELGRNMLGAYGLLPSKEYINHVDASPATFGDNAIPSGITTQMVQAFGGVIDSYDEYKDFLFGNGGRTNPLIGETNLPINLSQDLFFFKQKTAYEIDAWTPPEDMRVIEVAGWGLETVASMEYYPKSVSCPPGAVTCPPYALDERPRFTSDGDGTVVVPSAQYMNFLGNAEKYWVDFKNYNTILRLNREHKDILEVDSLNNFIKSIIEAGDVALDNVVKDNEPIDTENRFRISIHSPVTLDAYDYATVPNHTGKICPPDFDFCYVEENITNSSYMEFGEGKYLNLPEDEMGSIEIKGIDTGIFTYESEKVLTNGTTTTTIFKDIPVTPETIAEVTLNSAGALLLQLDQNGDGVPETDIIAPEGRTVTMPYVFSGTPS